MEKKIRGMIDAIFADMTMSAENLALRDELIANAMARYDDSISGGKSEEEAFAEVASSLEDVRATLVEMNEQEKAEEEPEESEPQNAGADDFANAVSKAFDALGDFGKQVFPQMGKFAKQADEATGKVFSEFGKAVGKGAVEVGKFAGETLDKISKNIQGAASKRELSAEELLARAKEIRIQAEIRQEADDQEGARQLRRKAYEMEMQAEAMRKAAEAKAAEKIVEPDAETVEAEMKTEDIFDDAEAIISEAVDELDFDFDAQVEQILDDVESINIDEKAENVIVINRFDPSLVTEVSIGLDADDVEVVPSDDLTLDVEWESGTGENVQPLISIENGVLKISRKNPDVFKTFFSVFKKEGGKVILHIPAGTVLKYGITTTSGDIALSRVIASAVRVNATSGKISVFPDQAESIRINAVSSKIDVATIADEINATVVSGNMDVKARTGKINLNTVSGAVRAVLVADDITVESVSGNAEISCEAVPAGRVKTSSVSGAVRLVLPEGIKGFKAEATGIGGIANEFGPNAYGTCELPIRFDSMSGRLTIAKG